MKAICILGRTMIREYKKKSELEELSPVIREIWREHYTPMIGAEQVEYMLDRFQSVEAMTRQIAEEHYRYFGIFCDGELAGYYAVQSTGGDRVFLSKFYVAAKFRGRGLGRQMLDHLMTDAVQAGAKTVWLTVNKQNSSVDIYRKLGFAVAEEIVTDIGNGFVMDDYKMEKNIEPC